MEESYSLLGNRLYNPLWGIDNGELRNSRVATMKRPELVVAWDYRLTVSTSMHLTADLYYAVEGVTSLAWFDAPTPLPDNYHYLPSYYDYPADKKYVTDVWLSNDLRYTQIDWAGMRHTNALQSDGHARYVVESRKEELQEIIHSVFAMAGAEVEVSGSYPGWKPNLKSHILDVMKSTYQANYGVEPRVIIIHAGLECGIIGRNYPGMDMISFGPTIKYPHSPDERVNIATVAKFYEYLLATLKAL